MVYYNVKWIQTLLLVTLYKMCVDAFGDIRYPAKPLSNSTVLGSRKVTCERDNDERKLYPNEAYRCYNMRIDGLRLRHLNIKSYGRGSDSGPPGGEKYDAKNNIAALCTELLKENGVAKSLWTVYAKDVLNEATTKDRLIFVKSRRGFSWEETPEGLGYIKTITCMVEDS